MLIFKCINVCLCIQTVIVGKLKSIEYIMLYCIQINSIDIHIGK